MTQQEIELDWQRRVFDSLSYPTRILKTDCTIVAVNKRFIEEIDEDAEAVIGKKCSVVNRKYFPNQEFPCEDESKCPLAKSKKLKKGQSIVFHTRGQDGGEKWEDRVFSPIMGEDGEVAYIIESIRDVTKVKVLEKKYSGIRELINNVVQSSVSAIMAADRNGNIILMNEAAEELFGYTVKEANSVHIEDFYPKGVAREIMRKLRDSSIGEKGKLPSTKVNIVTKNDEEIPVEMTAAIIYEDGKESATAAIFNDLREKLAVEKQLKEAQIQVLQTEKMASLGRLAAGVAHEINNPLTSILLYGNIMQEKLTESDPLRKNLGFILEDTERCRDIVKNLLAYSRQTSSKKEVFPINELVTEGLTLIRDQKLFMHVEVIKDLVETPIYVKADKKQLCQVVINLIINALDAMDHKGTLTFRTSSDASGDKGYIAVTDSGCGIPEENVSKIFDPFFTTKDPGKGTGLGLSMAYGILEENGGRISIKETGPTGTTILLQLPKIADSAGLLFDSIG